MLNLPKKVSIVEVGPRDGLQNEEKIVSFEDKIRYIELLVQAGISNMEGSSFVKKELIPQLADSFDVAQGVKGKKFRTCSFSFLTPNVQGVRNAIDAGVKEIALFTSPSDTFNKKNINLTMNESFKSLDEMSKIARQNGLKIRGYISTVFGCPYEGKISLSKLKKVCDKLFECGAYEISLGDTIGVANPKQVTELLSYLFKFFDKNTLALHMHDTEGLAISNILVSLSMGITTFDSSSGGLGGCPYAKGASGNVATEDLVNLFESMGVKTGINMEKLVKASSYILKILKRESPSKSYNAYKLKKG
jgi:hydroxymethylglutaryl-CoA lyase